MKRTFFALAVATAIGMTGFAAMAEDHMTNGKRPSMEEMKKRHAEKFAKHDKDGDGSLSKDEFQAAHMERSAKAFDMMDKDKNGKLTKEELKEGRKAWHDKMREHRQKYQDMKGKQAQ